jgi:hypothetical protein
VADGSDDIGGPSAGIEESEVDELVWAVVVTDVSVDDEITSDGSGGASTLANLARLANGGALALFLMTSTISCPFEFLVKVP